MPEGKSRQGGTPARPSPQGTARRGNVRSWQGFRAFPSLFTTHNPALRAFTTRGSSPTASWMDLGFREVVANWASSCSSSSASSPKERSA